MRLNCLSICVTNVHAHITGYQETLTRSTPSSFRWISGKFRRTSQILMSQVRESAVELINIKLTLRNIKVKVTLLHEES